MRKSLIILSIIFLIISNGLIVDGQSRVGNTNIAIAQGGSANTNVTNNAKLGPISIEIKNDRGRRWIFLKYNLLLV